MCANISGLIYIKLILISALNKVLISALNKALISALNKERMCLYRPFIFVTDDVPYALPKVLAVSELLPMVICRCIEMLAWFQQERVMYTVK